MHKSKTGFPAIPHGINTFIAELPNNVNSIGEKFTTLKPAAETNVISCLASSLQGIPAGSERVMAAEDAQFQKHHANFAVSIKSMKYLQRSGISESHT